MKTKRHPLALVTGGAGFIGSHVVDALIERGWRVTVIDNLSSGKRRNVHPAAAFLKMDVGNPNASKWIIRNKPDAVLHFAAQINVRRSVADPVGDAETNIRATLKLLDAASRAKVKRFIFAGSGGALCGDENPIPMKEHQVSEPMSPYAISKRTIEFYGEFYQREYGLPFVSLRFANVYGPRQNAKGEAGVISIFISRMLANEPVTINGTGRATRDYVFVADVVGAIVRVLELKGFVGIYHVGTGKETSVNDVFKRTAKLLEYKKKPRHGPADTSAPMRSALDASLLTKLAGWKPKVGLQDGLKQTVLYYQTMDRATKKICLYPFRRDSKKVC